MRSRRRLLLGGIVAVLVLMAAGAAFLFKGGGVAKFASPAYEMGFAGTIIRYASRSYDGAAWQVVKRATSLGDLGAVGLDSDVVQLSRIYGYDEQHQFLVDAKGAIFRLEEGEWRYVVFLPDLRKSPHGHVLGPDTLLVGGQWGRLNRPPQNMIHRVGAGGLRSFALQNEEKARDRSQPVQRGDAITPLAPGITYVATGSVYTGTSHKISDGRIHVLDPGKGHKDAVIVDHDGATIRMERMRVGVPTPQNFWRSATFAPGDVVAIARFDPRYHEPMLVTYRDGAWMRIEDIPLQDSDAYVAVWISRDASGKVFCIFAGKGQAAVYRQGRGITSHPLNALTSATQGNLINVWGASPEHFWVMDGSGSVWEMLDGRWRHVVRGMYEDDIMFNHSWVGPSGIVYAITDDTLYKLE